MNEFIIESVIELIPVDSFDLKEGVSGIIDVDNNLIVCTFLHIENKTDKLVCVDKNNQRHLVEELFQLKTFIGDIDVMITKKDWPLILANELFDNDEVSTFQIKPLKFIDGIYSNECQICFVFFDGGKSQKVCPSCCLEHGTATLLKQTEDIKGKFKSMQYTYIDMTKIAEWAFNKGITNRDLPTSKMRKLIENYLNHTYGDNSN